MSGSVTVSAGFSIEELRKRPGRPAHETLACATEGAGPTGSVPAVTAVAGRPSRSRREGGPGLHRSPRRSRPLTNARLRDRRRRPDRPDPNRSALRTLARSQCWWSALVRACRYRTRASHAATANARRDPVVASSIQNAPRPKRTRCRAVVATPPPAPGSCPGSQAIGQ